MKLQGVRVLDLSRYLPGPLLSMMMADHGAEVVAIEGAAGEPTRHIGPSVDGHTAYFRNTYRGKKSCVLDLKTSDGRDALLRLAEKADVFIESFRPGVAAKLGCDYEAIRKVSPAIVYCSISAFGQDGSSSRRPAHDLGIQAVSGVLSLSRCKDGFPAMPALPFSDVTAGLTALSAILMALLRREKSNEGDYIDISMLDTLLPWTAPIAHRVFSEKMSPDLEHERLYGGAALYGIYRTADDRYIVLSGAEPKFAENLLSALERRDLIELCGRPPGPQQRPVRQFLEQIFVTKTRDEWSSWFADLDVCFAPVHDLTEGLLQSAVRDREMVIDDPDGAIRIGTPIKFRNEPGYVLDRCPELGEHSSEATKR